MGRLIGLALMVSAVVGLFYCLYRTNHDSPFETYRRYKEDKKQAKPKVFSYRIEQDLVNNNYIVVLLMNKEVYYGVTPGFFNAVTETFEEAVQKGIEFVDKANAKWNPPKNVVVVADSNDLNSKEGK
jgi:hypothetical protein